MTHNCRGRGIKCCPGQDILNPESSVIILSSSVTVSVFSLSVTNERLAPYSESQIRPKCILVHPLLKGGRVIAYCDHFSHFSDACLKLKQKFKTKLHDQIYEVSLYSFQTFELSRQCEVGERSS